MKATLCEKCPSCNGVGNTLGILSLPKPCKACSGTGSKLTKVQPTPYRYLVVVELESPFACDEQQIANFVRDSLCKCEADKERVYALPITNLPQQTTIGVIERMLVK